MRARLLDGLRAFRFIFLLAWVFALHPSYVGNAVDEV
jgi:hypothetical protein